MKNIMTIAGIAFGVIVLDKMLGISAKITTPKTGA